MGEIDDLLRRIGRAAVDDVGGAGRFRRLALGRIDIDHDGRVPVHLLMQSQAHQAQAAGADDHGRLGLERRHFFQGAERGHARAGQRRDALRRQIADVGEIARMRHHQVIGVPAVREHAEAFHRPAKILVAAPARAAGPAADPRIGEHARADA